MRHCNFWKLSDRLKFNNNLPFYEEIKTLTFDDMAFVGYIQFSLALNRESSKPKFDTERFFVD